MRNAKSLFFSVAMLLSTHALSQAYESTPCTCCGNTSLKTLLKGSPLSGLYVHECGIGGAGFLASSFLKPGSVAPKDPTKDPSYKPSTDSDKDIELREQFAIDFDLWSCSYAASMLTDGNVKTAWVEGTAGDGAGEVAIAISIDPAKKVEILSGFGKSDALFKANNRPKTIKVHLLQAKSGDVSQCGRIYESVRLLTSKTVVLKDLNGFQPLAVPAYKAETFTRDNTEYDYAYWLMIEIVDVYPGSKYKDTCISEIRNSR
jgi:hypothetical protein